MSRSTIGLIVICILSLSGAVLISLMSPDSSLLSIFVLPLVLLGDGLRALSLLSSLGNAAAIALFVLLSLLPLLPFFVRMIKGQKMHLSDMLLAGISACTFAVLYLFINPQLIPAFFNPQMPSVDIMIDARKVLIAVAYFSIWAGYLAPWFLRTAKKDNLISNMEKLLYLFAVLCIVSVCYSSVSELIAQVSKVSAAITAHNSYNMPGQPVGSAPVVDILLAVTRFAANVIPTLLLMKIFVPAAKLLQSIRKDPHAKENSGLAAQIVSGAKISIYFLVGCTIANNVIQLLFARHASDVDVNLNFPIYQILLALSMLLLANFLAGDHKLYKENQLFI